MKMGERGDKAVNLPRSKRRRGVRNRLRIHASVSRPSLLGYTPACNICICMNSIPIIIAIVDLHSTFWGRNRDGAHRAGAGTAPITPAHTHIPLLKERWSRAWLLAPGARRLAEPHFNETIQKIGKRRPPHHQKAAGAATPLRLNSSSLFSQPTGREFVGRQIRLQDQARVFKYVYYYYHFRLIYLFFMRWGRRERRACEHMSPSGRGSVFWEERPASSSRCLSRGGQG